MVLAHDHVPKLSEKAPLKWPHKKIREHLFGGAMLDINVLKIVLVHDEKITDIDVAGIGPA